MGRIVGRYALLIIISIQSFFLYADISLRIRDHQSRSIDRITAGYPFIIEVSLNGEHGSLRNPLVGQLDRFTQVGRETKMYTINGKASITYLYTVTAREPGVYKIGPAQVKYKGKTVASKSISLTVIEAKEEAADTADQAESILVRLASSKKRAVVGECIRCSLQVLSCDDSVMVDSVAQPVWEHCKVEGPSDPLKRTEIIDGISYHCIEWVWQLYPTQPGPLFIPASAVDFKVPLSEKDNTLARFSFFFRQHYKNKRIYSNPLTVHVDPLPAYNGQVHGIGTFSSFNAELKPSVAQEGQGMILTLSVQRSYDSAVLHEPVVRGVSENVRVYDSKRYSVDQKNGFQVDCREYVVQGVKPGNIKIPSQSFTYFDSASRVYKTIRSPAIHGTVLAPSIEKQTHVSQSETPDHVQDDVPQEIKPLWRDTISCPQPAREIPVMLFIALMSIPIMIFLGLALQDWFNHIKRRTFGSDKKRAFIKARKRLLEAKKNGAYDQLYPLFIQLFSHRFSVSKADITAQEITQLLANSGLSEQDLLAWNRFFSYLSELIFFKKLPHGAHGQDELFERAYDWLSILEKHI